MSPRSVRTVKLPPSSWVISTWLPLGSFVFCPYGIVVATTSRLSSITELPRHSRDLRAACLDVLQFRELRGRYGRAGLRAMGGEGRDEIRRKILGIAPLDLRAGEH